MFDQETNYEFDWIDPFESLTVIRFSCSEKFIEEPDNNDIGRASKIQRLSFQNCLAVSSVERLASH